MRNKRVRDRERKWEEEGERERERGSPTQLPGEKTALLLTQDSLCLTTLPSSPSLSLPDTLTNLLVFFQILRHHVF